MAEFTLQKLDTEQAQYKVHLIACDKLPGAAEQRYLGSYGNAQAAFNKAVGLFNDVSYCPDCLGAR